MLISSDGSSCMLLFRSLASPVEYITFRHPRCQKARDDLGILDGVKIMERNWLFPERCGDVMGRLATQMSLVGGPHDQDFWTSAWPT